MERNKEIQKIRIMSYFVQATLEIIEKEGIEKVTVRKVSQIAGYNPATLYNYFDNLDYLVAFASIKYLRDYHISLAQEVEIIEDPWERFFSIWEKFCFYSFRDPKIYRAVFFLTPKYTICDLLEMYYKMFPEEKEEHSESIERMMMGCTLASRNMIVFMDACHSKGIKLSRSQAHQFNEIMILIYRGKLSQIIENQVAEEALGQAAKEVVTYIRTILKAIC